MTALIGYAMTGIACIALACYMGHRLRTMHGPAYPTAFVLGEGTRTSPQQEARTMAKERFVTRGGVRLE